MTLLPTWRYLLEMIRYRRCLYLLHATLWGSMNLSALLVGLLARAFFDTLTGQSPGAVGAGVNGLLALLVLIAVTQATLWLVAGSVEITLRFTMRAGDCATTLSATTCSQEDCDWLCCARSSCARSSCARSITANRGLACSSVWQSPSRQLVAHRRFPAG